MRIAVVDMQNAMTRRSGSTIVASVVNTGPTSVREAIGQVVAPGAEGLDPPSHTQLTRRVGPHPPQVRRAGFGAPARQSAAVVGKRYSDTVATPSASGNPLALMTP